MSTVSVEQKMDIEQWLAETKQKKKILFAQKVREANRLIRRHNRGGQPVENLTVTRIVDVAKEIVLRNMARQGKVCDFDLLGEDAGAVLVEEILESLPDEKRFVPEESISRKTVAEVLRIMNIIRSGSQKGRDAEDGIETSRFSKLQNLIILYENDLEQKQVYDANFLLKKAIDIIDKTPDILSYLEAAAIGVLMPMELTYLERQFLHKVNRSDYVEVSYQIPDESAKRSYRFFRGYGLVNEIQFVIDDILQKNRPFGTVNLLYTSTEQETFIRSVMEQNKIPYRMLSGYSAMNVSYIHLMKQILLWIKGGEISSIEQMLKDSGCLRYEQRKEAQEEQRSLSQEMELALRKTFDLTNQPEGIKVAEFFWNIVEIQKEYKPAKSLQWRTAKTIYDEEKKKFLLMKEVENYQQAAEIVLQEIEMLRMTEEESTDSVSVMRVGTRYVLEREYNYVIGLSAALFQKTAAESPVLSDEELAERIEDTEGYVAYSKDLEKMKESMLWDTFASLPEGEVVLGYSFYDTLNMGECSPSLFYLDALSNYGKNTELKNVEKKSYTLIPYRCVEKDKLFPEERMQEEQAAQEEKTQQEDEYSLSPSAIASLLHCPLQYYYHYIRHIPEQKERNSDVSRWLFADEKGTLVHSILEDYCNQVFLGKEKVDPRFQEDLFVDIFQKYLAEIVYIHPYQSKSIYAQEADEIRTCLSQYLTNMHAQFSKDGNLWKVEACEYEIDTKKKYEIRFDDGDVKKIEFKGKIDRIDSFTDEKGIKHIRLVDYKSGMRNKQENKIKNHVWVQHTAYAFAMENSTENTQVDCFVYEFPFDQKSSSLEIRGDELKRMDTKVDTFLWNILGERKFASCNRMTDRGDWKKPDLCKYCSYSGICREGIGTQL